MEDENSGAQGALEDAQAGQDTQAQARQEGASSAQVCSDADVDYKGLIEERDRRIAELEAQAAEAAKSAERADKMGAEIAELREQAKSDRIDFELRLAGVRNVKATRAVHENHDARRRRGVVVPGMPAWHSPSRWHAVPLFAHRKDLIWQTASHTQRTTPPCSIACTSARPWPGS